MLFHIFANLFFAAGVSCLLLTSVSQDTLFGSKRMKKTGPHSQCVVGEQDNEMPFWDNYRYFGDLLKVSYI